MSQQTSKLFRDHVVWDLHRVLLLDCECDLDFRMRMPPGANARDDCWEVLVTSVSSGQQGNMPRFLPVVIQYNLKAVSGENSSPGFELTHNIINRHPWIYVAKFEKQQGHPQTYNVLNRPLCRDNPWTVSGTTKSGASFDNSKSKNRDPHLNRMKWDLNKAGGWKFNFAIHVPNSYRNVTLTLSSAARKDRNSPHTSDLFWTLKGLYACFNASRTQQDEIFVSPEYQVEILQEVISNVVAHMHANLNVRDDRVPERHFRFPNFFGQGSSRNLWHI
ncbi:hypothetical protein C8R43DRAFT_955596 [Mycena crocata]|nr:hypothetical protein C8R43DRAFT_955596 [Mycena crocata]